MIRIDYINSYPSKTEFKAKAELKRESLKANSELTRIKRSDAKKGDSFLYVVNETKEEASRKKVVF